MIRLTIFFLLVVLASRAQTKTTVDAHKLTIISLPDSLLTYIGDLSAGTQATYILPTESEVKKLLTAHQQKHSTQMQVIVKAANTGAGDSYKVIENVQMLGRILFAQNISFKGALIDSLEQDRFKVEMLQMPAPPSEPLKLYLPKDEPQQQKNLDPKRTLTIIPADNKIYYYPGTLSKRGDIKEVPYDKLRSTIAAFKSKIGDSIFICIKPAESAGYKNIVDVLDEMSIGNIKSYAMLDLTGEEEQMLGLKGFMSIVTDEEVITKQVVTEAPEPYDLAFELTTDNKASYIDGSSNKKKNIASPTKDNIKRIIDGVAAQLNKKPNELKVSITAHKNAKFEHYSQFVNAFKEKEIFNFQMTTKE